MPAMPWPCVQCSRRTSCRATSTPTLGAPWIPASDIQKFAAELFNVPPEAFKIGHLKKDAVWSVEPDYRAIQSVAATADYGTGRINGTELLVAGLNLKTPVIYDIVRRGQRRRAGPQPGRRRPREKQKLIKEKFKAGSSAIPTAPSGWSGITTTRTTICGQGCSTARTWTSRG